MAISSLSRFTVPIGDNASAVSSGLLMPKLKYRFRVTMTNFGVTKRINELTKQVMTVARPNVQFDSQTIDVYNSKIFYAGKHTWQPISLTIRDDVLGEVSRLVGEQVQKQFDMLEQVSAASGSDYKFNMSIEILDGGNGVGGNAQSGPTVLEKFELYGCFLTDINYNELTYAESSPVDITMSIQYDNALQLNSAGNPSGIGVAVGRSVRQTLTG
jgi:hypothetical protein